MSVDKASSLDKEKRYIPRRLLTTRGDILHRGASNAERLGAGVAGKYLKSQGPGADLVYDTPAGGDARVPRTIFQHAHIDEDNSFPAGGLAVAGDMFILLPDNWNGIDKIYIWLLANAIWTNVPFDITVDVGSCDEAPNTHTQTVLGTLLTVANNRYYCWDITTICATVIALMNARDMLWIKVTEQWGIAGYVIGVEIQET